MSMRTPTRTRTSLLVSLVATIVALAIAEITVRGLDLGPDLNVVSLQNLRLSENVVLRYELAPGTPDGRFRISSLGFRNREVPSEKPAGTTRILTIGDSIAYGFGVEQDETLARHLESLLDAATPPATAPPRYEVLNLGVSGYNIEQVVEALRVRGLPLDPDIIVYAYCLNDPQAYSFELETLRAELSDAALSYRDTLLRGSRRWIDRSRLAMLARFAARSWATERQARAVPPDEQWMAIGNGSYEDYFSRLYEEGPALERLDRGIADLSRIADDSGVPILIAIYPVFADPMAYRLADVHRRIADRFTAGGLSALDLRDLYLESFDPDGPGFVYNALHPNGLGHRLAGVFLIERMLANGVLSAPFTDLTRLDAEPRDRDLRQIVEEVRAGPAAE